MGQDGYPTDEELKLVKEWPYTDYKGLIEYLQDIFWSPDWCITVKGKRILKVWISTGGWSGNEDIIMALHRNFMFWATCWVWHKTGGHYFFRIDLKRK